MSFLALVLIHIFLGVFSFVICTVRWFISLIVTLNIQLCTCIFLFPPLKQSHQLQVNEISLHLGSSAGMNPHSFPGCSLSLCHLPSMARLSLIATCLSGGKPSSCEGGSCYGSRSAWSLPCCRALLKHLCRDHSSWVTTSWTSNEMCRAKLSLEMLWLNFQ